MGLGLGDLGQAGYPHISCLSRVFMGLSAPVLGVGGLRGQSSPHLPPTALSHLSVTGPAKSSQGFRLHVGVVFLPLRTQLAAASGRDPIAPHGWWPSCHCVTMCGCRNVGSGHRDPELVPQAHVPEEEAAVPSPAVTVAAVGRGLEGGPCWWLGPRGATDLMA